MPNKAFKTIILFLLVFFVATLTATSARDPGDDRINPGHPPDEIDLVDLGHPPIAPIDLGHPPEIDLGHPPDGLQTVAMQPHPYWGWSTWRDPFWPGYYSPYYYPVETRGRIRIRDFEKTDQVYINGAFAGIVDDLGSIRLEQGRYNIQILRHGESLVNRDIYVIRDKTVYIRPVEEG